MTQRLLQRRVDRWLDLATGIVELECGHRQSIRIGLFAMLSKMAGEYPDDERLTTFRVVCDGCAAIPRPGRAREVHA